MCVSSPTLERSYQCIVWCLFSNKTPWVHDLMFLKQPQTPYRKVICLSCKLHAPFWCFNDENVSSSSSSQALISCYLVSPSDHTFQPLFITDFTIMNNVHSAQLQALHLPWTLFKADRKRQAFSSQQLFLFLGCLWVNFIICIL